MSGSDFAGDLITLIDSNGNRLPIRRNIVDLWQRVKNFLNTELIGVELRRKDIINGMNLTGGKFTTLDCYLNYLHKAGYLYKPKRGWYGLAVTIPTDLSVDDCRSEAYGIIDQDGIRRVISRPDEHRIMSVPKTPIRNSHKESEFFDKEEFDI